MPESVAWQLQRCAAEHTHLGGVEHSISFDVKLAGDGNVDAVALRSSTLLDEGLEACMAGALRCFRWATSRCTARSLDLEVPCRLSRGRC